MSFDKTDMQWDGTGEGNFTRKGSTESIVYKGDWSTRYTDKNWLLGQVHSDVSWMTCTAVNIAPLGVDTTNTGPLFAKLTASFEDSSSSSQWKVQGDVFDWDLSVDIGGEALTLKENDWMWSDTSVDLKANESTNAVKVVPLATVTATGLWPNEWDKTKVASLIGVVNDASYLGFSTHELMFNGLNVSPGTNESGSDTNTLSYHFLWNPHTWRKFYRQSTTPPVWAAIVKSGGSTYPYSEGDFSDLSPDNW